MRTKACLKCHRVLPADGKNFGSSKYTSDGLQRYCIDCSLAAHAVKHGRVINKDGKRQVFIEKPMTTGQKVAHHGFPIVTATITAAIIYFVLKYMGV